MGKRGEATTWNCWASDSDVGAVEPMRAYTARDAAEMFAHHYLADAGDMEDGSEVRVFVRPEAGGTVRVFDVELEIEMNFMGHELTGSVLSDAIAEAGVELLAEKVEAADAADQ